MAYYARRGVRCVGYDIAKDVVDSINAGKIPFVNLEHWLGFSIEPLVNNGLIHATSYVTEILEDTHTPVHFVAVPTEKNGTPWDGALLDVSKKLSAKKIGGRPDLIIVESTLAPGQSDDTLVETLRRSGRKVPDEFLVAVAPRRDWFDNPGLNVHTIPRVVGGVNEESRREAIDVLGVICSRIVPVSNNKVAELVKSTENSFRALNIAFANALSRSYPNVDVNELITAAATKWNYVAHYPGIGTGGYCIPLAPKYLLEGATNKGDQLDFLAMINTINESQTDFVSNVVAKALPGSRVGILGMSYKRNLKVHVLSPSLALAKSLQRKKKEVLIHDPFYSADEIKQIAGVETFSYPKDLKTLDAIIVAVPHSEYTETPVPILTKSVRRGVLVIDAEGAWDSYRHFFNKKGIDYRRIGDAEWANPKPI
jgi:nucleotide sugar dehydrogenase